MHPNIQTGFRALADQTRRDILHHLADGEHTIAELTQHFDMTRAAVKKHLTVLSDGGLITTRVQGRERLNSLDPQGFAPLRDWIGFFDQFWDEKLDSLKTAIEGDHTKDTNND